MLIRTHTLFTGVLVSAFALAAVSFAFAQSETGTSSATSTLTTDTATSSADLVAATSSVTNTKQIAPAPSANLPVLSLEKQLRVTNLAANISNRSEAYVRRLELIAVRIDSRIAKIEALGYDMGDARFYTTEARDALSDATTELRDIDLRINRLVTSENYLNDWAKLRLTFTETRAHLERAKSLLQSAIADMKLSLEEGIPAAVPQTEAATTSASSTASTTVVTP